MESKLSNLQTTESNLVIVKDAQDLKCGDVFIFRDKYYIALVNVTDIRHAQTVITAIAEDDVQVSSTNVTYLQLFRTFQVSVIRHVDMKLTRLSNERHEVTEEDENRLEKMLQEERK